MARRVYFCFHYQDVIDFRANVVRHHWVTKANREAAGFFDASLWETAKRTGPVAVKRLINAGLDGTTVSCVLVGSHTYLRRWVRYEVLKSFRRGNRLLAVHINSIRGRDGAVKPRGPNPLAYVGVTFSETGETATLWQKVGADWAKYTAMDGRGSYRCPRVAPEYRGKGFNLSQWYGEYDWVTDAGYANFVNWIE